MNIDDFFARQEKRNFPLPKKSQRKPYITSKTISWGGKQITIALKASGSGKVELLEDGEKVNGLYIQGTEWRELEREGMKLKQILTGR